MIVDVNRFLFSRVQSFDNSTRPNDRSLFKRRQGNILGILRICSFGRRGENCTVTLLGLFTNVRVSYFRREI